MDALQYLKEKYETGGNAHCYQYPDLPISTSLEKVCNYMQEYSDQQNAELLAWKESAMRELNALDLQSLGAKLGIGLGQSVSENIHAKVDGLLERVKELEEIIVGINSCQMVGITWPNELKQKVEKIWEESE